jgi:hypothetical protein
MQLVAATAGITLRLDPSCGKPNCITTLTGQNCTLVAVHRKSGTRTVTPATVTPDGLYADAALTSGSIPMPGVWDMQIVPDNAPPGLPCAVSFAPRL